jgi:hypothetical protein
VVSSRFFFLQDIKPFSTLNKAPREAVGTILTRITLSLLIVTHSFWFTSAIRNVRIP